MATLNHIAYNIAEMQGRADDMAFVEQKKFQIEYTRSLLFRRDFERTPAMPIQMIQTLEGLDVISVDAAAGAGVEIGCSIYRTKVKIPAPINLKGSNAFVFVGTIDQARSFSYIDPNSLEYLQYNKFQKTPKGFYYKDGYIYLVNTTPKKITVRYILDRPSELMDMFKPSGEAYFNEEDVYPITGDLIQRVTQTILATEARVDGQEDDHKINVDEQ